MRFRERQAPPGQRETVRPPAQVMWVQDVCTYLPRTLEKVAVTALAAFIVN